MPLQKKSPSQYVILHCCCCCITFDSKNIVILVLLELLPMFLFQAQQLLQSMLSVLRHSDKLLVTLGSCCRSCHLCEDTLTTSHVLEAVAGLVVGCGDTPPILQNLEYVAEHIAEHLVNVKTLSITCVFLDADKCLWGCIISGLASRYASQ